MFVAVNIKLYEYRHEQVKIRKKRWNHKKNKDMLLKLNMKTESKQQKEGSSVPRVPVVDTCTLLLTYNIAWIWTRTSKHKGKNTKWNNKEIKKLHWK